MALISKLRNFKAADDVFLDLKICLGYGTVIGNYVGSNSYKHYEFLITGSPLDQLGKLDSAASPGEVLLSSEFHQMVTEVVVTEPSTKKKNFLTISRLKQQTPLHADSQSQQRTIKLELGHQETLKLFSEQVRGSGREESDETKMRNQG